jgi:non-ribosomal peptide synthetase component F
MTIASSSRRIKSAATGRTQGGGAYVPLKPAFPRERLKRMLDNSGARLINTLSNLLSAFPTTTIVTWRLHLPTSAAPHPLYSLSARD